MSDNNNRYVLDDREDAELHRLGVQHRVWREQSLDVCRRAGFTSGQTLIDVGCGPGYLCRDLAKTVGPEGNVIGIDRSQGFVDHAAKVAPNVTAITGDAATFTLDEPVDGAICRWVLMFIAEPDKVIANVARALKPGAVFAVMEYFDFCSISLRPDGVQFAKVYDAVHSLITNAGGDPDIGSRMPALLSSNGFAGVDTYEIRRSGRPGSELWEWLELVNANHTNLLDDALISQETLSAYAREWREHTARDDSEIDAPPVMVTIGRRV